MKIFLFRKKLINFLRKIIQRSLLRQKSYSELIEYFKDPPRENIQGLNVSPLRYSEKTLNARSKFLFGLLNDLVHKDSTIMELGCGIGRNLNYLYNKGFQNIYGIDINKEAIDLAPEVYPKLKNIENNLFLGSLEETLQSYRKDQFDVTFTMCCLMHIHKEVEQEVFSSIKRITKKFLVTMEIEDSIHNTHFPRDYNHVFKKLGFKQKYEYDNHEKIKKIFGSDVRVRIMIKL